MPSTETLSRCRHCGAPLAGEKGRRHCPRCHPDKVHLDRTQLDLFVAKSPDVVSPERMSAPLLPASAPPLALPTPSRRSPLHYSAVALGTLIVIAGLVWSVYQLWPRGTVERSIVQAFAAQPRFIERMGTANPFDAIRVDGDSSPAFADLDGDDAPNLILGSRSGETRLYRNAGSATHPRFPRLANNASGLVATDTSNSVAFADLRGLHRLDAVNGGTNGVLTYFENRGTRNRADFVLLAPERDPIAFRAAPAHSYDWRPAFVDIDHDGDLDLFVGTRDGSILFFENRGSLRQPDFSLITRVNSFGLRGAGLLVALAFGDLDGDGDPDALVANAAGELRYFENRGTAWNPKFFLAPAGALGLPNVSAEATLALVDLDADGDLDLVTGGADGRLRYFENLSAPTR